MTDQQKEIGSEASGRDAEMDNLAAHVGESVEAWNDDLPPEDDFHDTDDMGHEPIGDDIEGETHLEAEGEDNAEAEGGEEETAPAVDAGRGKKVLYGLLVLGALFVGGLAYLQFGGSGAPEDKGVGLRLASMYDDKQSKRPLPPASAMPEAESVTPTTGETDLTSLYKAAQQQTQGGAMALPNAANVDPAAGKPASGTSTEILTLSDQAPIPMPENALPSKAPAPEPVAVKKASAPSIAKVEEVPLPRAASSAKTPAQAAPPAPNAFGASVPAVSESLTAGASAALSPEMETRLKTMGQQVESLQKSLDEALKKNVDLVTQLEKAQSRQVALEGGETEKAQMQEQLKRLESQLASARSTVASRETSGVAHRGGIALQEETSLTQSENVPSKAVKKKAATTVKKKTKRTAEAAVASSSSKRWVLRAATPDAAWVSKTPYAEDLQRVAVGETLAGIGRVVSIHQKGQSWEVVGTSGSLR